MTRDLADLEQSLQPLARAFPIPIRVLFVPQARTLAEVRNVGLNAVTTPWVHFLDSDTIVPPDYFQRLEQALRAHHPRAVCFQLAFAPAPTPSRWARYEAEIDRWAIGRYIGPHRLCGLNGMNFLARADVLRALGGFASEMVAAEDIELGYRLFRAGVPMAFFPEVIVFHDYPTRWRDLLRRKFWHGQGYGLLLRRHPDFFRHLPSSWRWRNALRRPGLLFYGLIAHIAFAFGMASTLARGLRGRTKRKPVIRFSFRNAVRSCLTTRPWRRDA